MHILKGIVCVIGRFLLAVQFLTRLPVPFSPVMREIDIGKCTVFFPLVGALVGCLVGLINYALSLVFPQGVCAAAVVIGLLIFTGGLHADGLADTADGLLSGKPREIALEIMKDSRVGAMGVLAIFSVLLFKYALVNALPQPKIILAIIYATTLSRYTMVLSIAYFKYARKGPGLGRAFLGKTRGWRILGATCFTALVLAFAGWLLGIVLIIAAVALTWLWGSYITKRLGGFTGDSYGALSELTEVLILFIICSLKEWC